MPLPPTLENVAAFGTACAFMLAIALGQAAVLKAVRPAETTSGFAALGVPGAPIVARLIPLVELGVASLLLWVPRIGGMAALATLGAFSLVLARAIRAGVRAGCNCFGQTKGQPVSGIDIARNALLVGWAAAALLTERPVANTAITALAAVVTLVPGLALLRWMRARQARRPQVEPTT